MRRKRFDVSCFVLFSFGVYVAGGEVHVPSAASIARRREFPGEGECEKGAGAIRAEED